MSSTIQNQESNSNIYAEQVLCHERDLEENGMKVVDFDGVEGGKVLLVKQGGKISALGTKCSHYGAPLVTGVLGEGRIRCPWHGACFNISTGDIEDFPGLDSIPCYSVEMQKDGFVKVKAKKDDLKANKRMKVMSKRDLSNKDAFIILGAGAAGLVCAETLRQEGFTGRIVMVSEEPYLPYDRIKLSKMLDAKPENITLRHEAFYQEHNLEILLNKRAESVDPEARKVTLNDGSVLDFTALFVATGNKSKKIEISGIDLKNVFTLRNLEDAHSINTVLALDKKVVVIGSSFIGMEVAAFCKGKCESITVVGRSEVPFKESLGLKLGERIKRFFEEKGVIWKGGAGLASLHEGVDKCVASVALTDSTSIPADIVVLGLGSTPATDFLPPSIRSNANKTVPVSKYMETSAKYIWAGGDIVEAEIIGGTRGKESIGHWGLAHYHGKIAALNMVGKKTSLNAVPFFWTMLFGTSFRYAGYTRGYEEEYLVGDLESLKCSVYYVKDGIVVAVATVANDPIAAQYAELLARGQSLTKEKLEQHPTNWWLVT